MPYTPPAGDDADLQFGGPYTPRDGNDANLTWETGVLRAQGFCSARFGAPLGPTSITSTRFGTANAYTPTFPASLGPTATFGDPRLIQPGVATGIVPTAAFGDIFIPILAKGFTSTTFGLPNSPYTQTCTPDGFSSTAFGDHRLQSRHQVYAAFPSTVVSLAYTPVNRTAIATGAAPSTQVGMPTGTRRTPGGLGRLTQAFGFADITFGTPTAVRVQTGAATSIHSTAFGAPTSLGGRAASGFSRTRMGRRHRAKQVMDGRYASGFASGGGLGAPSSVIRNRVAAMPPTTAFGTPLLNRSTTC